LIIHFRVSPHKGKQALWASHSLRLIYKPNGLSKKYRAAH
jgi:hypothetical protein